MSSNNALNQNSPNFTVNQITIFNAPVVGTDGTNKTYVDMIAAGFNFKNSTVAGTTTALTVLYANGAAGVGATLTNAGVQAAFSVDGVTPALNSRILVKNQASAFQNGVYTLTTVGSGASNWVLTRATDYDTVAEINPGDIVPIEQGTINATTLWLQTATVAVIGTDAINFSQFFGGGINAIVGNSGTATASGGSITISGGNNITTTGVGSTLTVAVTGTTNHNVQIGNASGSLTSVAPSATSGVPLISQGAAADPVFGTAVVAGGGTGDTSFTAYAVITGGTTSTGPLQSIASVGTSGQFLTSNGAGALPTFQTAAATSITITGNTGGGLTGNSFTFSGGTTGLSFGGSGTTETLSGTVVIANGGTNATSFATTDGTVYFDGTRLVTTATGTSGQILTSAGAGVAPSYQSPAASSITITGNSGGGLTGNSFTFTGGTTGLSFSGAGTTETLTGTLAVANGGTNATSFATTDGTVYYDGTRLVTTATGTAGQILTSGGAGVAPTYQTAGSITTAFNSVVIQKFTASGTYTPTSGMQYCIVEAVGGGGGGGGIPATSAAQIVASSGGGAGGYARIVLSAATVGVSQTVTIGAGGTGGASGVNNGNNGNASSLGTLCVGGAGGQGFSANNANIAQAIGGNGGTGTTGTLLITGGDGGSCGGLFSVVSYATGGQGGASVFGGGAKSATAVNNSVAGSNGNAYGSGGGGAANAASQSGQAGGNGASGVVIVTEFVH